MALRLLTTVGLFYFIMCEDRHDQNFIEIAFDSLPDHIWLHTTLEDLWPQYMILEVSWDGLWTLSFGLSQFHGHGSWLMCEVTLSEEASTFLTCGKFKLKKTKKRTWSCKVHFKWKCVCIQFNHTKLSPGPHHPNQVNFLCNVGYAQPKQWFGNTHFHLEISCQPPTLKWTATHFSFFADMS